MSNHPGDPRADVLGEIPFDHDGWPRHTYTPPPPPPPAGNVNNYIPFRGHEQHGVPNQRDPRADIEAPLAGEGEALRKSITPPTPRDLLPSKPIPVQLVDRPDLLFRRDIHTATYLVKSTAPTQLAPFDPFRKRLIITTAPAGSDTVRLYLASSPDMIESVGFLCPPGFTLDTTATDPVWMIAVLTGDPGTQAGTRCGVWIETVQSNGDPLL